MNSLKKSRKNIDAESMYEMRRQGMTNKQIADQLEVHVSTVYANIGRKSEAVKHAEVQNKPPVVEKPIDEMHVIDGSIQCWNDHNEKDILKPMDFHADPDGQFVRCGDIHGRISFLRSKRFSYLRRWFNVHPRRKG